MLPYFRFLKNITKERQIIKKEMTLKIFYALMLLSRMEMPSSLTINRQANGDIGPRVFCPNKTYFGKQNKECIQKVEGRQLLKKRITVQ